MNQQETNKITKTISPPLCNNNDDDNKLNNRYLNVSLPEIRQRDKYVDAPRQIPKKSYSLAADMINGWKPKKPNRINFQNVFPINFTCNIVDQIVKNLIKKNSKYQLIYLGPRKANSYLLHQHQIYQNPYPIDKRVQGYVSQRPGVNKSIKLNTSNLLFNSDFQSGNLDIAVKISDIQYDLFMRVDSNTRGHTNWFYFKVQNGTWLGSVKFNICNFRRQRSLYQRGMKPYTKSFKQGNEWMQKGNNVQYSRKSLRYKFLYEDEDETIDQLLSTYYTMTFTYNFDSVNDKVQFAYCIPYTYSDLLGLIRQVSTATVFKYETGWRTLSGLSVPVLQITDFQQSNLNKKVVLVTARVHPGQSNSSYVCDGLIRSLCSEQAKIKQMLKKFHFYIVPMLNPDGVIAGNYRTSLFGKDLNRTFNQARKYAFPESFNLIQYAKILKKQHKQRFTIYLDLHGHSTKKNSFFYGPDYGLAHSFYNKSRQLAKILGNITTMFRYYSCVFHISNQKSTTARATFNRVLNIPFTYTLQTSNGAYYDSIYKTERPFTSKNLKQIGSALVRGLHIWTQNENFASRVTKSVNYITQSDQQQANEEKNIREQQPPGKQRMSDDQIEEGKSDSQPQGQDMNAQQLEKLEKQIQGKAVTPQIQSPQKQKFRQLSPQKSERPKQSRMNFDWTNNLRQSYNSYSRKDNPKIRKQKLPPINLQSNPVQFLGNMSQKKRITIVQALKNLTSTDLNPKNLQKSKRLSISQMMINQRQSFLDEQHELLLQNKLKKIQRVDRIKRRN